MKRGAALVVLATLAAHSGLLLSRSPSFLDDDRRIVAGAVSLSDPAPLRALSFALDRAVAGEDPRWFRLHGLLLHAAGAVLVLALLRRFGAGAGPAALGALAYGIHPVQAEAVGLAAARGDLLGVAMFLGALFLHHRSRGFDRPFLGAAALLAAAILASRTAVVFPAAALLTDFFFRDGRRPGATARRWPVYLALAALAGTVLWLHASRGAPWWPWAERFGGSAGTTALTMARGFVVYLRLLALPVDLATDWRPVPVTQADPLTLLCAATFLGFLAAAVIRAFRGGGAFAFAALWALVAILPAANLLAPAGIPTAERFLLLPMAGLALPAGLALARAFGRGAPGRIAGGLLLAALGALCFSRGREFASEGTLARASLGRFESPRGLAWRAATRLEEGSTLKSRAQLAFDAGRTEPAAAYAERGLAVLRNAAADYDRAIALLTRLAPGARDTTRLRTDRALCWLEQGHIPLAKAEIERILAEGRPEARGRLLLVRGLVLARMGDPRAGSRVGEAALAIEDPPDARRRMAGVYYHLSRWYARAIQNMAGAYLALRRSWELHPDPERNGEVLAALRAAEEEYRGRAEALRARLAERPRDTAVALTLAVLRADFGDFSEAARDFETLASPARLGRDPDLLFAWAQHYWLNQDTVDGYDQAERLLREIARVVPDYPGLDAALADVAGMREALEISLAR